MPICCAILPRIPGRASMSASDVRKLTIHALSANLPSMTAFDLYAEHYRGQLDAVAEYVPGFGGVTVTVTALSALVASVPATVVYVTVCVACSEPSTICVAVA